MGLPLASAVHFSKWQRWHAFKDAKSYLWSSSSFSSFFEIFQFLNFGGDLDGDENIRRKMRDAFEDETIGELSSPGILEKFFLMEIRWFPFFSLTLKFRENSKSHRVVEMLQDIWRLLSPENENGREMTMKVVAINGGFYLMESVFQEEYFSLEYLHLLNDLINVAQIGFLTIGGGITWQKKKKMRKTKAHEIEEILSF